jgi:hypothetical protein
MQKKMVNIRFPTPKIRITLNSCIFMYLSIDFFIRIREQIKAIKEL